MLGALGVALVVASYTAGQSTSQPLATCTDPQYAWTFNTKGQSPCAIASYLGGTCNGGQFNIPPLDVDEFYVGPFVTQANSCRCSSVFYSLLSACSLCQTRQYLKWSAYNSNCTTPYLSIFLNNIPAGTSVPHYAYLDVSASDEFDPITAQANDDLPESSGVPQITMTGGNKPTSPASSNKGSGTNAGAIAGGVVGGVVFLALVAALAFWLIRRRRRRGTSTAHSASVSVPGTHTTTAPTPMSFNSASPFAAAPSPKLYDPSDPSTYPSTATASSLYTTQEQQPFLGLNQPGNVYHVPQQGQGRHYTGAPEI